MLKEAQLDGTATNIDTLTAKAWNRSRPSVSACDVSDHPHHDKTRHSKQNGFDSRSATDQTCLRYTLLPEQFAPVMRATRLPSAM